MDEERKKKLVLAPVKILAIIIAFMIITKFGFVFYSFIQDPFPEPLILPQGAVKHVMTALILLELLILTVQFLIKDNIDPNMIIIAVLTVLGKNIMVLDFQAMDYRNLFGTGFIFAITILGLYILRSKVKGF